MAASTLTNFCLDDIKYFLLDRGGRVTNHELVSNFKSYLNHPTYRDIARQQFKDYVNQLATVKQIEGIKYLVLKAEYMQDHYGYQQNNYYEPESPFTSPISFHSPSVPYKETTNLQPSSLPPMAKLPTRTFFEEVCQAVQQQNTIPHSESSPAGFNRSQTPSNEPYTSPLMSPSSPFNNVGLPPSFSQRFNSPRQEMPPLPEYKEPPPLPEYRNPPPLPEYKAPPPPVRDEQFRSDRFVPQQLNFSKSADDIQQPEFVPNPPPRKRSLNLKNEGNLHRSKSEDASLQVVNLSSEKENMPVVKDQNSEEVLSPVSVRERAQKLNKIVSETELNMIKNKRYDRISSKHGDDDDSSSITSLDPLHREWTIASAKCDYNTLLRLLKVEHKLYKAKDYISGYTALHWGAKHGNCDIIKLIAGRYGLNPNVRTNGGYTPLHLAAMHAHEECMDLLIGTYGADCNIRDYSGKKPRQYMENMETTVSEQVRKKYTEAQNKKNSEKDTPSFLRIGSLNVKVQKTISSMSLRNSQNKSWGSADNLQELLEKQQMPAPKFVPVKRNRSKKINRFSNYLEAKSDQTNSSDLMEQVKQQQKAQRRSSFHNT